MKQKILITGINGFLGSHLAKWLKEKYEIIGFEYSLENLSRIENENFLVYSAQETSLEKVFSAHEFFAVIHVATIYKSKDEDVSQLLETNFNLPVKLMELATANSVNLFLNTDSFFNNESYKYSYLSEYTLSKKHALEWLKLLSKKGVCKVINMKIFHMYGENDSLNKFIPFVIDTIKNNKETLELTPGLQSRDFIYVKDVARAYEIILDKTEKLDDYHEFEVGTGIQYSLKHLVMTIKNITNSSIQLNFGALPYRAGEIMESKADISDLEKLGFEIKYDIVKGISETLDKSE